ncbi:hypothetical protein CC80DRAFT_594440 [Byssothecium circinans]|uniref:SprT-like domain-containing protein n=1 Tax=Byssothecium circinans TaxID=147558 RepID=A0A6A5TU35_9PLEO|nr:hypothetical protein CC80DRAFT_594440 [Byssothecium circinans]
MLPFLKTHLSTLSANIVHGHATPTPIPQTLSDLESLIHTLDKKCPCDTCQPSHRLRRKNCLLSTHPTFNLSLNLIPNHHSHIVYAPPPKPLSFLHLKPEIMHLTRTTIQYFFRPVADLKPPQHAARSAIRLWRDTHWHDITTIPSSPDARALITAPEMLQLWKNLNTLFFGTHIRRLAFRWRRSLSTLGAAFRTDGLGIPYIAMNPLKHSQQFGGYVLLDVISTLVHEAIHVFLRCRACGFCRSRGADLGNGGHGSAFQILGRALEEAGPRLLGLPLRLGRLEAVLGSWKGRGEAGVPSLCEFGAWGLSDDWAFEGDADVRRLIERAREVGEGRREGLGLGEYAGVREVVECVFGRNGDGSLSSWLRWRRGADGERVGEE